MQWCQHLRSWIWRLPVYTSHCLVLALIHLPQPHKVLLERKLQYKWICKTIFVSKLTLEYQPTCVVQKSLKVPSPGRNSLAFMGYHKISFAFGRLLNYAGQSETLTFHYTLLHYYYYYSKRATLIKVKVPNSRYCCSLCGRRWKGKGEFGRARECVGRARGKGKETSFPSRARPNSPFPFPFQCRPCRLILLPQETRRDSW